MNGTLILEEGKTPIEAFDTKWFRKYIDNSPNKEQEIEILKNNGDGELEFEVRNSSNKLIGYLLVSILFIKFKSIETFNKEKKCNMCEIVQKECYDNSPWKDDTKFVNCIHQD